MSGKWFIPGSLVMAVPIVALILPYAVGAYHLEIGGRALGEIDPLNWWYLGPPEGWHSEYAYPTAFLSSPDEEERSTLFLHAGSQVTYTPTLTQPAALSFGMGLDP